MRNPADILLHRRPELHRPGGHDSDDSTIEPIAVLEESRQPTELIAGKAKLGRFSCVRYSMEVPENPNDESVEVHVNGLAAAKPTYRRVRRASAGTGQISVSISPERGTVVGDLMHPLSMLHPEKYEAESVLAVIEDIERRFGLLLAKLRSHSMGGRAGVAVAEAAPEKVSHVTLVNAAGLEEHSLFEMAARVPRFVNREVRPNMGLLYQEFHSPQVLLDIGSYVMVNPLRTGAEALSISRADIRDRVRRLGAQGIAVSIIDAPSDSLVPNKTVADTLGLDVHHYSMHSNPLIGHLGPQIHAQETVEEYRLADQAVLTRLEQAS